MSNISLRLPMFTPLQKVEGREESRPEAECSLPRKLRLPPPDRAQLIDPPFVDRYPDFKLARIPMKRRSFLHLTSGAAGLVILPDLQGADRQSLPALGESANPYRLAFESPPAAFRPMPQWSWNGTIERDRVVEVLRQYAEQGCGGVFMHARWGITNEYLSEEWFELWEFARAEAEKLGLEWHIYDEFTAPGGHAGGHTVARAPHTAQQQLKLVPVVDPGTRFRSGLLGWFAVDPESKTLRAIDGKERREASLDNPVFALVRERVKPKHSGNEFPLPDLTHPDAVKAFIESTYEPYHEHSGSDFGDSVRFSFCDEPHLNAERDCWPISLYLLREFQEDHGYALPDHLGDLCGATVDSPRVRYQYWSTVNRLWNQNFMKPLYDWCETHGLEFTGHLMEHEWPETTSQPDAMASFRWMQAPGNDLLGLQFEFDGPESNLRFLLNLKEMSSVANQLGREHVVVESSGAAGYWADFELFKSCEDYLAALGTNVYSPHISHYTLSGVRKYDFAQTISDHSPWWNFYHHHADHVGRLVAALDGSREENRVLVFHPTTSAWLHSTPEGPFWGDDESRRKFERIRADQQQLLHELYARQIDFDLGDEFILEEFGSIDGEHLVVGECRYEALVLPRTVETLLPSTRKLLEEWVAAGGAIIDAGAPLDRIAGVEDDAVRALRDSAGNRWRVAEGNPALVDAVAEAVPPRLEAPGGEDIVWRRAVVPGEGTVWFFCNPWLEPIRTRARIPGDQAIELDTRTGDWIPGDPAEGSLELELDLPSRGHALFLVKDEPVAAPAILPSRPREEVGLTLQGIRLLEDNRLIIDYCDLEAGEVRAGDVQAPAANRKLWNYAGFEGLSRGRLKNYRDLQTTKFLDPDLQARVSYHFQVDDGISSDILEQLEVAVERPEHFVVRLNGEVLRGGWSPWFDVEMATHAIGHAVRRGANRLDILSQPLSRELEIAPVYVLGDFSLRPAARGFAIAPRQDMELGDWTGQGAPFYPAGVRYAFETELDADAERLELELPDWAGSVAHVHWNGAEIDAILHPPHRLALPGAKAGRHRLEIDVYGKMQNMMGPFYDRPGFHIVHWLGAPTHQPPGSDYRTLPSGLREKPVLRV